MASTKQHDGALVNPIAALEGYLAAAGTSILRAAFAHSYFVDPEAVRARTPWFPNAVRASQTHYPGVSRGSPAEWQGREVLIDRTGNQKAQDAWSAYTGRGLARGSGYGVRHIWGNPWDPDAFTAGWNLCYMPFWAGMLTEKQHKHPDLECAVRQASWDLYFRENPVCEPPHYVSDPGADLGTFLGAQPILVLTSQAKAVLETPAAPAPRAGVTALEHTRARIREIRSRTNQSWLNLEKAVRALQGKPHDAFGTKNVEASSKSVIRRILKETGLDLGQLEEVLDSFQASPAKTEETDLGN